jgi:transcriptional regulator NrdR family protein
MNLVVGFPCPNCGHEEANLLALERNQNAEVIGFRLSCNKCESVFASRLTSEETQTYVAAQKEVARSWVA